MQVVKTENHRVQHPLRIENNDLKLDNLYYFNPSCLHLIKLFQLIILSHTLLCLKSFYQGSFYEI